MTPLSRRLRALVVIAVVALAADIASASPITTTDVFPPGVLSPSDDFHILVTTLIAPGVEADLIDNNPVGQSTITNIRNVTGVTADDFHIRISTSGVITTYSYALTGSPGGSVIVMDGQVSHGGFLMVNSMRESITTGNVYTIQDAFWTNSAGGRITPVPEPATLLLLGGGIIGLVSRRWIKHSKGD